MSALGTFSATDLATQHIRELIASGALPQGSKVKIEDLAVDLGISRTPVRDALGRLQIEGLIKIVPRVGVYVRSIGVAEVLEVYTIKEALEPVMAQWATERATKEQREEFFRSADELVDLAASGDSAGYIELVVQRRLQLLELSGSQVLAEIFHSIDGRVRILRRRNLSQPERLQSSVKEHLAIARAVRSGNAELAGERTRLHVRSARESLMRLTESDSSEDNR